MSKRFLLILAALFIILIGAIVISKRNDTAAPTDPGATTTEGSNHTQGAGTGGVTLVEFGDFECPACGSYFPLLQQVKAEFGDELKFQFRHFPLVNIHPNAMAAHRAAEAAGRQDKFFDMHDLLYARQASWSSSQNVAQIFEDYAAELGLNVDTFKQDVAAQSVLDIINADMKLGQSVGAQATPTFVLNGQVLNSPPQTVDGFIDLIRQEIDKQ